MYVSKQSPDLILFLLIELQVDLFALELSRGELASLWSVGLDTGIGIYSLGSIDTD